MFFYRNTARRVQREMNDKQTKSTCNEILRQSRLACSDMRVQCALLREEKASGLGKNVELKFDQVVEKVDLILERQSQIILRIDKHINGEK